MFKAFSKRPKSNGSPKSKPKSSESTRGRSLNRSYKPRTLSLNRSPPKTRRTLSLNRNPPKSNKNKSNKSKSKSRSNPKSPRKTQKIKIGDRELPEDVLKIVSAYSKPVELNVYNRRPALKIMEKDDVYKWLDYVFGMEGKKHVINRIEQKGEYQIIHFNDLIATAYVDYLDDFYIDLDHFGALWIEKATEREYRHRLERERQPTQSGIEYSIKPLEGCWQIQYADPLTPKRIFEAQDEYVKKRFPDSVKVNYKLYGQNETGYVYSKNPRPKVKMTPFIPKSNANDNSNSDSNRDSNNE